MQKVTWQCRIAPSLGGGFAGTPNEAWGTVDYTDDTKPTVFFGLYGLPDFFALWRHKGRRAILWAGSDILYFEKGYWLEEGGYYHLNACDLAGWINKHCESWCENVVEKERLAKCGINAKVCPSFLGDVSKFKVTFRPSSMVTVYASVSGDDFKLYGWDVIERIAGKVPDVLFYLYGNKKPWKTKHRNVEVKGRVTQYLMNCQISQMTCGLRPLEFDGASEILIKSALMGQYPISRIPYPHIASYKTDAELVAQLKKLSTYKKPNLKARLYYQRVLNQLPWVK